MSLNRINLDFCRVVMEVSTMITTKPMAMTASIMTMTMTTKHTIYNHYFEYVAVPISGTFHMSANDSVDKSKMATLFIAGNEMPMLLK